jgi:hypothetical protein
VTTPDEFSLYISEHYRSADNRLRRMTVPRHRFASMHAGVPGGEFVMGTPEAGPCISALRLSENFGQGLADVFAIVVFQFAEDNCGKDG